MKKKTEEWSDQGRYEPTSCAVCEICFLDRVRSRLAGKPVCVYGGPYLGYRKVGGCRAEDSAGMGLSARVAEMADAPDLGSGSLE